MSARTPTPLIPLIPLINAEWSLAQTAPGQFAGPEDLTHAALTWIPASVPGTVASALHAAGQWDLERPIDIDAHDWWYRCAFNHNAHDACRDQLRLENSAIGRDPS